VNTATVAAADAITAEIIRSSLVAITDEMKTNLMRTAYNPIIYEALDYTVGLFDRDGDTISIGLGLPMFIRGLSDAIKAKIKHYGYDAIEPGDILLTNDAYIMGSHLNHMIFTIPIFHEGEIVAFSSSMAHWLDVGGTQGGVTRDIFSEGLQLPIVKIFKRGVQDDELTRIIQTNVRIPELAMGDFRAQIAAIRTGEARYAALIKRYGRTAIERSIHTIAEQSERAARAAVQTIPDGVYEAESYMDDDGVTTNPVPLKVRVIVEGDRMTIDLSDVSPQVSGYFNSGETAGRSAAQVAFKCLTTPSHYPINEGAFRPLTVILPPGLVVSARKPAAMGMWMTIPMTIVDTIFKALSQAVPERVAAAHYADLCIGVYYGIHPATGRLFIGGGNMPGGGWGAKHDSDGMSAVICINDGDTHNYVVESSELRFPFVVERYALRAGSGGAGEHRGGLGVEMRVHVLSPMSFNSFIERTKCAPWGIAGGHDALANRIRIERADGTVLKKDNGKLQMVQLERGDVIVVESGGGGGYGDPLRRNRNAVATDVRCGYISREEALNVYGMTLEELTAGGVPT
jgi:N-methylhydantoinase B